MFYVCTIKTPLIIYTAQFYERLSGSCLLCVVCVPFQNQQLGQTNCVLMLDVVLTVSVSVLYSQCQSQCQPPSLKTTCENIPVPEKRIESNWNCSLHVLYYIHSCTTCYMCTCTTPGTYKKSTCTRTAVPVHVCT